MASFNVLYITWENIYDKPQDLSGANLRYIFPSWNITYKDPRLKINDDLNNYNLLMIDAGIWAGAINDSILEILDKADSIITVVRMKGEWDRWIRWIPTNLLKFSSQFNHPNVDLVIGDEYTDVYLSYVVNKPIRYVGFPYALDYVQQFKQTKKEKIVDFRRCGSMHRWPSYGLINSLPDGWKGRIHLMNNEEMEEAEHHLLDMIIHDKSKFEIADVTHGWEEYLQQLSECSIMVAVDNRFTIGRFCMDAAALGIPCISGNQHSARTLFPDLITESYNVDNQLSLLNRLIHDNQFYTSVTEYANNHLNYYSYQDKRIRFINVLKELSINI